MRPARLGAVSYLNTRPLVRGLDTRPDLFTLRFDVPSLCAALLHGRQVDVGLIPAVEYLRGDYAIVVVAQEAAPAPPPKPAPAPSPEEASTDEAPRLHIDFRKIDGAWKIDHLLPMVMVTPRASVDAAWPSQPYYPNSVSPPSNR